MSDQQQAIREAVARAMWSAPSADDMVPWDELDADFQEAERRLADAAIGVVLSHAQAAIEALPISAVTADAFSEPWVFRTDVLAVLDGLRGDTRGEQPGEAQ